MMNLPKEVCLLVLEILIDEWIQVRTPLYNSEYVPDSIHARGIKRGLCELTRVCRIFYNILTPHIFHTIVFRPPPYPPPNTPTTGYRHLCQELLAGNEHAATIAGMVKQCIFVAWSKVGSGSNWEELESDDFQSYFTASNEQDLRALKQMKNLESLLFKNGPASLSQISDILASLPRIERLCLGTQTETVWQDFPYIHVHSKASTFSGGNIRDLVVHEWSISFLRYLSFPKIRTLHSPSARKEEDLIHFFKFGLSQPLINALHLDVYWFEVDPQDSGITVHPQLRLESVTCPLRFAPTILSNQPLTTIRLRTASSDRFPVEHYEQAVAALESISGQLQELEIPYMLCVLVPNWLKRVRTEVLRSLYITVKNSDKREKDIQYAQIWDMLERHSEQLSQLQVFKIPVQNYQLHIPFQHELATRLAPHLPSIQKFCFSEYVDLKYDKDSKTTWRAVLNLESKEAFSRYPETKLSLSGDVVVDDVGILDMDMIRSEYESDSDSGLDSDYF